MAPGTFAPVFPDASDLMVLETPILRVSRPVAACQRCRAAKVKCDGRLPACTACEKANKASECTSANDDFARGKERSYVATLETRIDKLEKRLAEARARRKSSVAMSDYDNSATATPRKLSVDMLKSMRSNNQRAFRKREAQDIDSLVADFGLLAVNATARDFHGFTSAMSYARLILAACSKEAMPHGLTKPLPERHAATPLIQHYFANIFALHPFFDESSFYASVDALYQPEKQESAMDHWMVRMVIAIASIACSDQRGDNNYLDAIGHVNAALEQAEEVLHPGSLASLQALLLLYQFSTLDPQHFDSWTLIGAVSRAMVDIGVHQDPSKNSGISKSKLEMRRRVFWCVYSLDRSTSLVYTRSFSFSDDSANVTLPFSSNGSPIKAPPSSTFWLPSFNTALDMWKLRQLQSAWYMDLFQSGRDPWPNPYPYIWRTYHQMTEWYGKISPSTSPSARTFFQIELMYSYVFILCPSPRCPRISTYAHRLIFEHCIAYATKLLALLNHSSSSSTKTPLTHYDAMRAYMTGRQFVDVLSQPNLDAILSPIPPTPPTVSPPIIKEEASVDPFSAAPPDAQICPPPLPSPREPSHSPGDFSTPPPLADPTNRAIQAVNDFTAILSRFGLRFGLVKWRDRYQAESSNVLHQLYIRAARRPSSTPPSAQSYQQAQRYSSSPNTQPTFSQNTYFPPFQGSISNSQSGQFGWGSVSNAGNGSFPMQNTTLTTPTTSSYQMPQQQPSASPGQLGIPYAYGMPASTPPAPNMLSARVDLSPGRGGTTIGGQQAVGEYCTWDSQQQSGDPTHWPTSGN